MFTVNKKTANLKAILTLIHKGVDMFLNKRTMLSITLLSSLYAPCVYSSETKTNFEEEPNPIGHLLSVTTSDSEPQRLHWLIRYLHQINPEHINAQRFKHHGYTPLHTALLREHHSDTIKLLLSLGADTTKANNHGLTPTEFACTLNPIPNSINTLVEHEAANPLIVERNKQKNGSNPLHYLMNRPQGATRLNTTVVCQLIENLVKCGYSINAQDEAGNTPLHYARALKQSEIVTSTLLDLDANNLVTNASGHAAVQYAPLFTITTSRFVGNS